MNRVKVDYGIDLGTTNSAICRMEAGTPVIKKMADQADTLPSCVQIKAAGRKTVGARAYRAVGEAAVAGLCGRESRTGDIFREFKRRMGSDMKYRSEVEGRDYAPEELSAEVLKTLKSVCTDEAVDAAVITIPAAFTEPQRNATMEAAKLAGIRQCRLLQEPVAAAMAYGLKQGGADGVWMVFDFGGGTFDAALIRSADGVIEVFDTEGDNYLGGKNIDEAVVNRLLLPLIEGRYAVGGLLGDPVRKGMLCDALKAVAEECKKQLSFKPSVSLEDLADDPFGKDDEGREIELAGAVTQERLREVCAPIYQEAVDCCVRLMKRNSLTGEKIGKVILVGGPTLSPVVREMLREQVSPNTDTSIDPMTAVATGAALFASTLAREEIREVSAETVRLDVRYAATTVQEMEFVTVKFAGGAPGGEHRIELVSRDGAWSSGQVAVSAQGEIIEAPLKAGKANVFDLRLTDAAGTPTPCFPEEITILQGIQVKAPPLAYGIGIETWDEVGKKGVFTPLQGLERNKPLPAVGSVSGLKAPERLRPGMPDDILRIPVYEGRDGREGKLAMLSDLVQEIRVAGTDVPEQIPAHAEVEITVRVNESGLWHMEVYFPGIDWTFEKDFELRKMNEAEISRSVDSMIRTAEKEIRNLEGHAGTENFRNRLKDIRQGRKEGVQAEKSQRDVKDLLAELEGMEDVSRWDVCEKEYEGVIALFEEIRPNLSAEALKTLDGLKGEFDALRAGRDVRAASGVLDDLRALYAKVNFRQIAAGFLYEMYRTFDSKSWKDRARARALLDIGARQIEQNAPTDALRQTFLALYSLLPEEERPDDGPDGLLIR